MKKYNKWLKAFLLIGVVFILVACGNTNEPINSESTGLWDRYILLNLSRLIMWLSNLFGGNYGLGIILFTFLIRILLLPLYRMQIKSQEKMQAIQPGLDAIRAKYPNQDRESMEQMQLEQQAYMEEQGVNQWASLWPMLIQLPVMIALYQSILRTEALREGSFLWMNLGEPDSYFIMPILAAALTFYNTYLTMKANPMSDQMPKVTLYMMPFMILLISIGLPSAISLYWVASNLFNVVQTLLFNNPYKKIAEQEAKRAHEKDQERRLRKAYRQASGKRRK